MKTPRTLLTWITIMAAGLACANEPAVPAAQAEPKATPVIRKPEMNPEARAKLLAHTGGTVQRPGDSRRVVFLNLQKRVAGKDLDVVKGTLSGLFRIESVLKVREDSPDAVKAAAAELKDEKIGAVIVIHDTPDAPSLLVAPEARWALVNVAALAADKPSAEILVERVQKQQWRAFAYLAGAAGTNAKTCLMKPIVSPAELDALGKAPSMETISKIMANVAGLGINPARVTSYRRACEEGWAPAPTNDIQKAIWKEIKDKK
jgi:hypothetical protein